MVLDKLLLEVKTVVQQNLEKIISMRRERVLKVDDSFVTSGDLLLQSIVMNIFKAEPDVVVVSEEDPVKEGQTKPGLIVVVDPIDGTENFTSGLPEWGISVSCFQNYKHVGSLLGCPELNLWMQSGDRIDRFNSRIRGLSSSLNKDELIQVLQGHEYRILGCCVYNMINVIRGSFLSFENPKGASSWDILGGLNLALEHNLKVTVDGKPYSGEYLPSDKKYRFCVEHR